MHISFPMRFCLLLAAKSVFDGKYTRRKILSLPGHKRKKNSPSKLAPAVISLCFLVFISGCSVFSHYQELITLKRVGDSQGEIDRYLKKQEKLFYKLSNDIKNNNLKEGAKKQRILAVYGDPILSKTLEDSPLQSEVLLYRHPTNYFSSQRIYLYFNPKGKLSKISIFH